MVNTIDIQQATQAWKKKGYVKLLLKIDDDLIQQFPFLYTFYSNLTYKNQT